MDPFTTPCHMSWPTRPQDIIPFTVWTDLTLHIVAAFARQESDQPDQFEQVRSLEEGAT